MPLPLVLSVGFSSVNLSSCFGNVRVSADGTAASFMSTLTRQKQIQSELDIPEKEPFCSLCIYFSWFQAKL